MSRWLTQSGAGGLSIASPGRAGEDITTGECVAVGTNGKALLRGASDVDAHARRLADAIGAVHAGAQVDDGPLTIRERMVLAAVRSGGSAGIT